MPASRATRKGIKWRKTVTAAEHRLREEMGLAPLRPRDDEYVSPAERERMIKERAALRAQFARLPLADRKARAGEFRDKLRPVCPSRRAFIGAWTGSFEPLLEADTDAPPTPARTQSRREADVRHAAVQVARPKPQQAKKKRGKKLGADGHIHVAAVEALLRDLDPAGLDAMRKAIEVFVRTAPDTTHAEVKGGIAKIGTALAAELRRRA